MTKNAIYIDKENGCVQIGSLKINELVETISNLERKIEGAEWIIHNLLLVIGADHLWDERRLNAVNGAKRYINSLANMHLDEELTQ